MYIHIKYILVFGLIEALLRKAVHVVVNSIQNAFRGLKSVPLAKWSFKADSCIIFNLADNKCWCYTCIICTCIYRFQFWKMFSWQHALWVYQLLVCICGGVTCEGATWSFEQEI